MCISNTPDYLTHTHTRTALTESSRTFLLRARDLWAKAEASLDSDSTVALMLFTQVNSELISECLYL